MQRKTKAWKDEWNRTIGGSRASAVLGMSPFQTPLEVADEMTGRVPPPDLDDKPDILRGVLLEGIARQRLAEALDIEIEDHDQDEFCYSSEFPHAHCLPDGHIRTRKMLAPGEEIEPGPVELKVPRPQTWRKFYEEGLPDYYQIQCQHNMGVLDADRMHFGALNPVTMEMLYILVRRDDRAIQQIMDGERKFMDRVLSGHDQDTTAASIDLPEQEKKVVVLDSAEAGEAAAKLLVAEMLFDDAKDIFEQRKATMFGLAGDAELFDVPGLLIGRNTLCKGKRSFDHKRAVAEDATLARFYKQGNPYRRATFRPAEK